MIDVDLRPAGVGTRRFVLALRALLVGTFALGLAACVGGTAGTAGKGEDGAPRGLEQRALARWQMIIDGKAEEAYAYLTPGYRQTRNRDAYIQKYRPGVIRWQSVEWRGTQCAEPDSCEVRLLLTYAASLPSAGEALSIRELNERWIQVKGEWYHLPSE